MLHLYGCPIEPDDAAWLVAELYRDAHPPAVAAAIAIEKGIERGSTPSLTRRTPRPARHRHAQRTGLT
jgi:hypothetical protein